jgi:hypothetical protein
MKRIIALLALALSLDLILAGCNKGSSPGAAPSVFSPSAAASSAQARVSAAASAIPSADIAQAKADIARCVTGTPLQQIHTVHVVLLERATGKNGAEVTATRAKVLGCLGVPPGQRTQFKNDSLAAAERQKPRVFTKAGIRQYALVTWPGILAECQKNGCPASSASPSPAVSS